jgi:uncharacterized membrane protein YkvA (DUF1232 family)
MFRYLLDSRVPFIKKLPILGWLIYLASPVDFLPDPVLGFGIIDDAVLLGFIMNYLSRRLEDYYSDRKKRHNEDSDRVIQGVEYEVSSDDDKNSG